MPETLDDSRPNLGTLQHFHNRIRGLPPQAFISLDVAPFRRKLARHKGRDVAGAVASVLMAKTHVRLQLQQSD
jgi:hypothetical protein